ncbi:MAG: lysophospholipid acyltransferase family protein [Rhodospirillales bacterium]
MTAIRSAAFAVLALLFTAVMSILLLPGLALPRKRFQRLAAFWCRGLLALLRWCCGLRWRLVGAGNLPAGPAIIAAKHQSAWDTLIFHVVLDDPVYVLKRELIRVPLFGWYLRKAGNIAIDRSAGLRAIRTMLPAVDRALAEGSQVIVFPEGTRTAPGERAAYQPGIAALYGRAKASVVPVALNSGLFWGRRHLRKRAGVIIIEILPAMPAELSRPAFLAELERRIEEATARLAEVADDGTNGRAPQYGGRRLEEQKPG